MSDKKDKKESEFGGQRVILIEGDKRYEMVKNYKTADDKGYETPEHVLETKLGENIQKIQSLEGVLVLTEDKEMKAVLNAKLEAYKDCSQSLIVVGQKINQFAEKLEEEK